MIQVCAAVIYFNGKYLLTTRSENRHLAGLWEFPGGKIHDSESVYECLIREIKEEIDLEVTPLDLMFSVIHHYPEKSVCINFYRVILNNSASFNPIAKEGQKIKLFAPGELTDCEIVPADLSMIAYLMLADL